MASTVWIKKYAPKNTSEIQGHNAAVKQIIDFVQDFKKSKKKGLILYGQPGNGKTSSIHAIVKELSLDILEVNASDQRNAEQISQVIGAASKQLSLFGKGKVILLDEIDGVSGSKDRGGILEIIKILKDTKFPIIMTALDPWDKKYSTLRSKCQLVEFKTLSYTSILSYLKKICNAENVEFIDDDLKALALRAGGDLRGAIIDLQISVINYKLEKNMIDELSGRKQTESILKALMKIFKSKDPKLSLESTENIDEDLNTLLLWIDQNLPSEYTNADDLYNAYDNLSKADIFLSRIRRWQHWRYLVYVKSFLTAGISLSKKEKYANFFTYQKPDRILKMWIAKQKRQKKRDICQKIAKKTHNSKKDVFSNQFDYFKETFKRDSNFQKSIISELDLNKEEVEFLLV